LLTNAAAAATARRIHPDTLTFAGLAVAIAGGVCLALSSDVPWLLLLIPPFALARTALNALDGMVARASGLARPWGEVLNETADRASDVALFGGLAWVWDPHAVAIAVAAMLLASYTGVAARAAGGPRQYGGVMGKADRMAWLSVGSLLAYALGSAVFGWLLTAVTIGAAVTAVQRLGAARAHFGQEP